MKVRFVFRINGDGNMSYKVDAALESIEQVKKIYPHAVVRVEIDHVCNNNVIPQ